MIARIIKSSSSKEYYGMCDNKLYTLAARGSLKQSSLKIKVGDFVEFDNGVIHKIIKRKNDFIRPNIANVDYVLLCMSLKQPNLDLNLLDKFLINIINQDVEPIIILTKLDLLTEIELEEIEKIFNYYKKYYKVFFSDIDGIKNSEELFELLKNKVSVVSGQTGAGKSHLLNTISPSLKLETNEISLALNRGKHTTTKTEIYDINNMYIADTPGFSSLEFTYIEKTDLKEYFPEFVEVLNMCKYNQCMHIKEPMCKVKEMVESKEILKSRYESYLKFFTELEGLKKIYGRK